MRGRGRKLAIATDASAPAPAKPDRMMAGPITEAHRLKRPRILSRAIADLDAIWLYIAQDNRHAADGIIEHFSIKFEAIFE